MSEVFIEELAGRKRTLALRGGALPLQGASWDVEQIIDTSWNPGSPVATQQTLGPTEPPSEWEGEWNTTRLVALPPSVSENGGTEILELADSVRDVMESFCRSGQLLRVTWAAKPGRRVMRYGRLKKCSFPTTRADDVKWKATFEWIGRIADSVGVSRQDQGLYQARVVAQAASDAAASIEAAAVIQSNPRIPFSSSWFNLGELERFVGQLEAIANSPLAIARQFGQTLKRFSAGFHRLADIIATAKDLPGDTLNSLSDAAKAAYEASNDFLKEMSVFSPEKMTSGQLLVEAQLGCIDFYSHVEDQVGAFVDQTSILYSRAVARKSALARTGSSLQSLSGPGDVFDTHVPRDGETMLSIARDFYQDGDLAYALARANGLPGQTISPPRGVLILPSRDVLSRYQGT